MYMADTPLDIISSTCGLPVRTIKSITHMITNESDRALREKVKQDYLHGMNSREIATKYGLKQATITLWLRKEGITRHRGPKSLISKEDFFECIDTEEKAYYLGWIMADGCVSCYNGQYSIKIGIGIVDRNIIDKFLTAIGSSNSTSTRDGKAYYVSLTSKKMFSDLGKHGVHPNKSGNETFPKLPSRLNNHFIRGYFDGDGITCVGKSKRSGFIAPRIVLDRIQEELGTSLSVYDIKGINVDMKYILGGIKFSRILYDYIYADATVWIERKRSRMDIICGNTEITSGNKGPLAS